MKARALVLTSVRGLLKVTKHSSRCASINAVHVCVGNYSKSSYSCHRSLETRRRLYTFSTDPITKSSESDEADTPPHISDHSEDSNDFATTYESEVDTSNTSLSSPGYYHSDDSNDLTAISDATFDESNTSSYSVPTEYDYSKDSDDYMTISRAEIDTASISSYNSDYYLPEEFNDHAETRRTVLQSTKFPGDLRSFQYLSCTYEDIDHVKSLGAKFDGKRKKWYIPEGVSASDFHQYKIHCPRTHSKDFKSSRYIFPTSPEERENAKSKGARFDGDNMMWYFEDEAASNGSIDSYGFKTWNPDFFYYIECPYEERDQCKEQGAIFDYLRFKKWFFKSKEEADEKGNKWPGYTFIPLDVPFSSKDHAKALGAKFNPVAKLWYAKDYEINGPLSDFLPESSKSVDHYTPSSSSSEDYVLNDISAREQDVEVDNHVDLEDKFIVFFDIETSGLPERPMYGETFPFRKLKAYDSCRVIQMCVMLCKAQCLTEVETKNVLIKANDFEISESSFAIHGISKEKTLEEGMDMKDALDREIFPLFSKAHFIACHNADFDTNVFKSELARGNYEEYLKHIEEKNVICTMKKTKDIVKARNKYDNLKNPSLKELYEFATEKEMIGHHDAKYDVLNLHEAVKSLLDSKQLELKHLYNDVVKSSQGGPSI